MKSRKGRKEEGGEIIEGGEEEGGDSQAAREGGIDKEGWDR